MHDTEVEPTLNAGSTRRPSRWRVAAALFKSVSEQSYCGPKRANTFVFSRLLCFVIVQNKVPVSWFFFLLWQQGGRCTPEKLGDAESMAVVVWSLQHASRESMESEGLVKAGTLEISGPGSSTPAWKLRSRFCDEGKTALSATCPTDSFKKARRRDRSPEESPVGKTQ